MVGVGEEDCRKQGKGFEDVELEYRDADMIEQDEGEVC